MPKSASPAVLRPSPGPRSRAKTGAPGGAAGVRAWIQGLPADPAWNALAPIPVTRELGRRFGVSNTTAHRALNRLENEGFLWRKWNGRFYLAAARARLNESGPVICLMRRLELWSAECRGLLAGVSEGCGAASLGMLFFHNPTLVEHAAKEFPPKYAGVAEQIELLDRFLGRLAGPVHGIVFDALWSDEAIARHRGRIGRAVILERRTALDFCRAATFDFAGAAALALDHLRSRRCERIVLAKPFDGCATVDNQCAAFHELARFQGIPRARLEIASAMTPQDRMGLARRAAQARERVGIFCPEDNVSSLLLDALLQEGGGRLENAALVSGMGTEVAVKRRITSVACDYFRLGREAIGLLDQKVPKTSVLSPTLYLGTTS